MIDEIILLYAWNNNANLEFGFKVSSSEFIEQEPNTYNLESEFAIAEITLSLALTEITDNEIKDVRYYGAGCEIKGAFAITKSLNERIRSYYSDSSGVYITGFHQTTGSLGIAKLDRKLDCTNYYIHTTIRPKRFMKTTNKYIFANSYDGAVDSVILNNVDNETLLEIGTGRKFVAGGNNIALSNGDVIAVGNNIFFCGRATSGPATNKLVKVDEDFNIITARSINSASADPKFLSTDNVYLYFALDNGANVEFFKFDLNLVLVASTRITGVANVDAMEWHEGKLCICTGTSFVLLDDNFSGGVSYPIAMRGFTKIKDGFIVHGGGNYYTFDNFFVAQKLTTGLTETSTMVRSQSLDSKSFIVTGSTLDGLTNSGVLTMISGFPLGTYSSEPSLLSYTTIITSLVSSPIVLTATTLTITNDSTITSSAFPLPLKNDNVLFFQTLKFLK